MLNKHGETCVLFNVDDKGLPIKKDISSKTLKDLSSDISLRIKPAVILDIEIANYKKIPIIKVYVRGHNKPYSADGEYLIKSRSENKKMLLDLANGSKYHIGKDTSNNLDWNSKLINDGKSQLWVSTKNGVVQNGGINTPPIKWDIETGFSYNPRKGEK